jgi:hypothetical protein
MEVSMFGLARLKTGYIIGVIVLLCATCPTTSLGQEKSVTISESKDGNGIVVAVSKALARQVLESALGSELGCKGDVDGEFENMLASLDRRGRRSSVTREDEDSIIIARRRGKKLKLDIRDRDDSTTIEAVMPWAIAECLLGKTTGLDGSAGDVRVKIKGEGGGTFEFRVD